MRKGAPVELDDEYVDEITEMSVDKVVRTWNACLDELSRKPKVWKRVDKSLRMYRTLLVDPSCKLYPMSKEGWKSFMEEIGQERVATLLSEAHDELFKIDDWYMLVVNGSLVSYGEDESGVVYPLALFMKALNYRIGGNHVFY